MFAQLKLVTDDLFGFISDAQDISAAFPEMQFDLEEFYTLLDSWSPLARTRQATSGRR